MSLKSVRKDYKQSALTLADLPDDPWELFATWLQDAKSVDAEDYNAFVLSTCSPEGRPSGRVVLLRAFQEGALHFFTNYQSQKGRELLANPMAAATFFWPALERQVRFVGSASQLDEAASDAYFESRPRSSQIGAWASLQSAPLEGALALEQRFEQLTAEFADLEQVPRPPHWGGFRLQPDEIEFWQGRPNRLHNRARYELGEAGGWTTQLLYP